jgi:hypothetical protein
MKLCHAYKFLILTRGETKYGIVHRTILNGQHAMLTNSWFYRCGNKHGMAHRTILNGQHAMLTSFDSYTWGNKAWHSSSHHIERAACHAYKFLGFTGAETSMAWRITPHLRALIYFYNFKSITCEN